MITAPTPPNEVDRIKALYALKILDTEPEEIFESLARLAAKIFDVPITSVCFVDSNRVWIKSEVGLPVKEIPRDKSICGHAIYDAQFNSKQNKIVEICDLKVDERFSDNPYVVDGPKIRYYMSYVLRSPQKHNIGTLCIMDTRPRSFTQEEKTMLIDLGNMLNEHLNYVDISSSFNLDDLATTSKFTYEIFDEMDALLKRKGITLTQWRILDKVVQSSFATPSFIGKELGLASSQVSKILEILEAKGLIDRTRSVGHRDRRLVKLECKKEGREIWNYGKRMSAQVFDKLKYTTE